MGIGPAAHRRSVHGHSSIGPCHIVDLPLGTSSIGLLAIGLLAIGLLAIGPSTIGLLAIGPFAIGPFAIGPLANGPYMALILKCSQFKCLLNSD